MSFEHAQLEEILELKAEIESLSAENRRMRDALIQIQGNYTKRGMIKRICHQALNPGSTRLDSDDAQQKPEYGYCHSCQKYHYEPCDSVDSQQK